MALAPAGKVPVHCKGHEQSVLHQTLAPRPPGGRRHSVGSPGRVAELAHLPIRYLVGSGAFSRTYLVEVDGFLHESPITWYTAKKKWAMSPGYDGPQHAGFDRPVAIGCLVCHAGRVEAVEGAVHRAIFH